jgi:hypothetical protein
MIFSLRVVVLASRNVSYSGIEKLKSSHVILTTEKPTCSLWSFTMPVPGTSHVDTFPRSFSKLQVSTILNARAKL